MYSYKKAIAQREETTIKPGLDRVQTLLEYIGRPQSAYPVIHIAGTNGKGSVAAMLESVLREHGLKVGIYTSPHIISLNERIRINGNLASDEQLERAYEILEPHCKDTTHFELVSALAFLIFKQEKIDVAVIEVGMGGRLDATNVVNPILTIITSLSLDHQQILGQTLMDIAKEKAGIIKPGVPLICAAAGHEGKHIEELARQKNSIVLRPVAPKLTTNLLGEHQKENLALAEMALRRLPWHIPYDVQQKGLQKVMWPGRLQYVATDLLLDAAHNADGMRTFCQFVKEESIAGAIVGFSADKDIISMITQLQKVVPTLIYTPFAWKRTWNPLSYISTFREQDYVAATPLEALAKAKKQMGTWGVCGSLFLQGEIFTALGITSEDLYNPQSKVYKQTVDWRN